MHFIRFYGGDGVLLGIQIIGVLVIYGWCFAVFIPFCLALKFMNFLRIDTIEEHVGMDISRHKGPAYRVHGVDENLIDTLNLSRRKLVVEPDSGPVKEQPKEQPEVQAESLASAEDPGYASFIKIVTD